MQYTCAIHPAKVLRRESALFPLNATTANVYRLIDEKPTWLERRAKCVAVLNSTDPHVIFVQECTETQEADLIAGLAPVGVWASATDKVNTGVLYRTDLFPRLVDTRDFTLLGVQGGRSRYAAGAILETVDGDRFCVVSPHLASTGDGHAPEARVSQTLQLLGQMKVWGVLDLPCILAGDWNDRVETGIVPHLKAAGFLDIRKTLGMSGSAIDRFFVNGQVAPTKLVHVPAGIASDHDFERAVLTVGNPPPPPQEEPLHGVDVSSWQPDWTPEPGDAYVFVKATQGTGYTNPHRDRQLAAARDLGRITGHYHWVEPGDPKAQAAHFVGSGNIRDGELLWADWEGDWQAGDHPSVEDAAVFIAEVKRLRPKNRVGLYCNRSDWTGTSVKAGDGLWIAEYGVTKPGITSRWDFWQYAREPIDQNRSRFSNVASLQSWANDVPVSPGPTGIAVKRSTKWNVEYRSWKGQGWVTVKDHAILTAIEAEAEPWWGSLNLTQGGLSTSVAASANTHAGLGAFDVRTAGNTKAEVWRLASMFLRSGMVFFARGYIADSFQNAKHGHVVSRESYDSLHPDAKAQYREYRDGGDGLVGSRKFTGPNTPLERWSDSPYNSANQRKQGGEYFVNVPGGSLLGLDIDRKKVTSHDHGTGLTIERQVRRWDRWNGWTSTGVLYAMDYLSTTRPD